MMAFTKHLRQETSIAFYTLFVIVISTLIPCKNLDASHAAGADLQYECLGNGEYRFTLNFYRDCDSISAPTDPDIPISSSCFSDTFTLPKDTVYEITQVCSDVTTSCNGGNYQGFENHIYSGTITLDTTCSDYTTSFEVSNRNNPVDNLDFSGVNPALFIDVSLDPTVCNSSPLFSTTPIPYLCTGSQFSYNHGTVDTDGDSLSYSLIYPLDGSGSPIPYVSPYSHTYPLATQSGNFSFDNNTGEMSFTPTTAQTSVVTVKVDEYRNGQLIGSIKRDMQFQIVNCANNQPTVVDTILNLQGGQMISNNKIEVCPDDSLSFAIKAFDPDSGQTLKMAANIDQYMPGASFDTVLNGTDTILGVFSLNPIGLEAGSNVLKVTVRDDKCPVLSSQTVSYNIFLLEGTFAYPNEKAYCPAGKPKEINVLGGNQYSWQPKSGIVSANSDSSTIQVSPNTPTTYIVEGDSSSHCQNRDTVFVDRVPNFSQTVVPLSIDTISECQNTQFDVIINPSDTMWGPYSFDWTPSSSLNNASIKNPIASPDEDTTYFLNVTSDTGCTIRDSVSVVVTSQIPDPLITGDDILCEGDSTQLNVEVCYSNVLFDDFDPKTDVSQWASLSGVTASPNCGAVSGSNALWFDNPSGTPRQAVTKSLNTKGGGNLEFYLKEGAGGTNCETPDAGEDIVLEYANNAGLWNPIDTFQTGNYTSFTFISAPIQGVAQTSNTQFRFRQLETTGIGFDNWAIDDVSYQC
ncbi:MAG: hypothetical protein BRD50_05050, partial [Bacteroidetes bacterium SW_11_45_7]